MCSMYCYLLSGGKVGPHRFLPPPSREAVSNSEKVRWSTQICVCSVFYTALSSLTLALFFVSLRSTIRTPRLCDRNRSNNS